jgi:hypothetical protein
MIKSKYKDFEKELAVIDHIERLKKRKVVVGESKGKAHITKSKKDFHFVYNGIFPYWQIKNSTSVLMGFCTR